MIKSIKQPKKVINKLKQEIKLKDQTIVSQATVITQLCQRNEEIKEEHEQIIGKEARKHQRLLKFQKKYQKSNSGNSRYWRTLCEHLENINIRDQKKYDADVELWMNKYNEENHKNLQIQNSFKQMIDKHIEEQDKSFQLREDDYKYEINRLKQGLQSNNLLIEELSKDGELWMDKYTEEQHKNFQLQEKLDQTKKFLAEANDALINHDYQRQGDLNNWSLFDDVDNAPEMCGICYSSGSDRIYKCNNSIHNCGFYFHEACTLRNLMYGTRKLECLYCLKTNFAPFEMRAIN
jgi:hypothetical protein